MSCSQIVTIYINSRTRTPYDHIYYHYYFNLSSIVLKMQLSIHNMNIPSNKHRNVNTQHHQILIKTTTTITVIRYAIIIEVRIDR